MVAVARIDCPYEHRPGGEAGAHHWQVEPRQGGPRWKRAPCGKAARRAGRRRAAKRDGDEGGDQVAGHTRHCIASRPARGVLQRQPRGSRRPREDTAMRHRLRPSLVAVLVLVAIGLALAGLWPSAEAQAPIVLKLGTVNPGESPRNLAANEFARVAAEKSKGRIKVEVYTNNQLARGEGATLDRKS